MRLIWGLQIVYAVLFALHAGFHLFPPAALRRQMEAQNIPRLRMISNLAEVPGSIGLIAPTLTHVGVWLTPLAAGGLLLILLAASIFHASRREFGAALFVLALAIPLAWLTWQLSTTL